MIVPVFIGGQNDWKIQCIMSICDLTKHLRTRKRVQCGFCIVYRFGGWSYKGTDKIKHPLLLVEEETC